ncbi:hypothetical protein KXW21_006105 [Aspergillus fumigatus]|nr:hypothetical protein KXW21_006105 [Aspergillus fumigatus]KAH2962590.1 hypothetical protein KXV49_005978 [Aspergillus fumigatus]
MRALYVVQSGAVALYALLAGIKVSASGVDPGFANPDVVYRPKFRYWLPDASVPADVVQEDIARIAEAGGGGIEFLPFYLYGLPTAQSMNATPPTDWNVYGFGTPAFNDLFRAALNASKESKVRMDFAIGANQGQGVPAVPGTPGLAVQLVSISSLLRSKDRPHSNTPVRLLGNTSVRAGERYSSTVPPPAELSSVLQSGLTFMHPLEDFGTPNLTAVIAYQVRNGSSSGDFKIVDLDPLSFVDLSAKVKDGGLNPTTVIGNGSWVVDHFDAMGARLITDFWDHHILSDEQTLTFLQEVGQYAWEDSIEMLSSLYWTPSLLTRFEQDRGADYRRTLNAGYQDYMTHFSQWTHRIGIQYSHQPAYNLPLEMLGDIPLPDAPECESLGFGDNVDAYRQFSGPAHLSNRNVVSNEMGAVFKPAYMLTIPELLYSIKRAWSGGVNMVVLHGLSLMCFKMELTLLFEQKSLLQTDQTIRPWFFASPEYNVSTFTLVREDVAARVVKFAQKGLPVVFVGGLPQVTSNSQAGQIVEDGWRRLRNLPSVQFISSLAEAGVRPDVLPSCTTGTLRVVKRSRPDDEVDYVFLHNDQAVPTSCQISIQDHKARTPHLLNAWTGEKKMIESFERRSAMVTVSLQFAPNETSILSLEKSGSRDLTKLTKTASSSTIRHYGIANLTRWDLSLEDFHAPHSRFQVQTAITSHNFSNIAIRPWSAISPELAKVGGIGRYSTSFTVPSVSRIRGKLSLGPIIHTARVYIGGQRLPPVDPVNPVIDISSYIRPGQTYKLIVEVTTPLFNRIKTDANHTKIAGSTAAELQPLYASTPYQEYGLMGPVVVTWSIST